VTVVVQLLLDALPWVLVKEQECPLQIGEMEEKMEFQQKPSRVLRKWAQMTLAMLADPE